MSGTPRATGVRLRFDRRCVKKYDDLAPDQPKPGNLRAQSASGREGPAAMGKHSSAVTRSNNNRRTVYITAVGLLVLSLGAVFVVRSFGSQSGADGFLGGGKACADPTQ